MLFTAVVWAWHMEPSSVENEVSGNLLGKVSWERAMHTCCVFACINMCATYTFNDTHVQCTQQVMSCKHVLLIMCSHMQCPIVVYLHDGTYMYHICMLCFICVNSLYWECMLLVFVCLCAYNVSLCVLTCVCKVNMHSVMHVHTCV